MALKITSPFPIKSSAPGWSHGDFRSVQDPKNPAIFTLVIPSKVLDHEKKELDPMGIANSLISETIGSAYRRLERDSFVIEEIPDEAEVAVEVASIDTLETAEVDAVKAEVSVFDTPVTDLNVSSKTVN